MSFLLYLCFFFSGAAGLLYESYWAQRFSLLLGVDIYSHAAVLTAFMGGLALGSELAGMVADRARRPWIVYALLELGIAACGLAIPFVLPMLTGPLSIMYTATNQAIGPMTAARFGAAVLILLAPTALMGATLPVMAVALRRSTDRLGEVVSRLYVLNTAGAVVGILAGGFLLGEAVGLFRTNLCAVSLNVLAAVLAMLAGYLERPREARIESAPLEPVADSPTPALAERDLPASAPVSGVLSGSTGLIALGAGITGAAAMMTQIGWTRMIAVSIGSSAYAFSLIVAVFLIGLAIGAKISETLIRRSTDAANPWAQQCLIAGALCWLVIPAMGQLPDLCGLVLLRLVRGMGWPVEAIIGVLGVITFAVLALPTIALGATLPLACEAYAQRRPRGTARVTGWVYAVNTVGAMLGSAAGGLVCIEWFGVQNTLRIAGAAYAFVGLIGTKIADGGAPLGRLVFPALCLGATLYLPWDRDKFVFARYLVRTGASAPDYKTIAYRESAEGNIAISSSASDANTVMTINGKPDASSKGDRPTMVTLGQIPMLLHGSAQDVALVGLGAGITLRSVVTHDVKSVELIELSQTIVDLVRPPHGGKGPFDEVNGRAMDDPRVRTIIADGRNHLLLTDKQYDVLISQPSNPWVAGVSSLFTHEYFETCKSRLKPGGLFCQWLQSYNLPAREFARIIRTIKGVFEESSIWISPDGIDYFIVAGQAPRPVLDQIERLMSKPEIRVDLASVGLNSAADVLGMYLFPGKAVLEMELGEGIGKVAELTPNTDDKNVLRYVAAKAIWQPQESVTYVALSQQARMPWVYLGMSLETRRETPTLVARIEDAQLVNLLSVMCEAVRNPLYRRVFAAALVNTGVDATIVRDWREILSKQKAPTDEERTQLMEIAAGMTRKARELLDRVPRAADSETAWRLAQTARAHALMTLGTIPQHGPALAALAEAEFRLGRRAAARETLRKAIHQGASVDELLRREIESAY